MRQRRPPSPVTIAPDTRHASLPQRAFKVETGAYAECGISGGHHVIAVEPGAWVGRYGDIDSRHLAVIEMSRPGVPGVETVVRETLNFGGVLIFESLSREEFDPDVPLTEGENGNGATVTVVGIVVSATRLF